MEPRRELSTELKEWIKSNIIAIELRLLDEEKAFKFLKLMKSFSNTDLSADLEVILKESRRISRGIKRELNRSG